jgi:hypothetical protein
VKKKTAKAQPVKAPTGSKTGPMLFLLAALAGISGAWFLLSKPGRSPALDHYVPRPAGSVTFNKEIAPILYEHCSVCHRPGGTGPFDLIVYTDARKRAEQIGKVTQDRYMPPWLPEHGVEEFVGARRLSAEQLGLIEQWIADGTPEGSPSELPPAPKWPDGWQLGAPDLVVTMPETYRLAAEGKDIYRNFVVPVPLTTNRFVQAVEFRAETKTIHHAFIRVDHSRQSRRLDAQDPEPGFGGMETPASAEGAGGHFLSWQPGRGPTRMPEGLAWPVQAGSDLVVQMHMQPSGKPEAVRASIALYFTDQPPTNTPTKIGLSSLAIDIPAGSTNFIVEDSYQLPVDVDLLAVLPHAHYLGKRLEGFAILPDGTRKTLLLIKNWDFNWQSDFRFAKPISLPKGTRLSMRYSYDNSTNNIRNPNQPPARVKYGLQSSDEMGELWLQILTRHNGDLEKLESDYGREVVDEIVIFNRFLLEQDPKNARAHNQLAKALLYKSLRAEAVSHFLTAVQLQPDNDEAHYHLGILAMDQNNPALAEAEFELTLRANPDHFKARNNLGLVCLQQNRLDEAEAHFNDVLRLNPGDAIATGNLRLVSRAKAGAQGR